MLETTRPACPDLPQLRLAPPRHLVSIAAFHGQSAALASALNVALPTTPATITAGAITYLWSGADSWLAMASAPDLEATIRAAAQTHAAITDQSAGRSIFLCDAITALPKLIPIDLHPGVFGTDATALTLAGHIPVQIWREGNSIALACFSSYAISLYESLRAAID